MPFYKLRPGHECGINDGIRARDLRRRDVIELPVRVAREVSEKLMPCTEEGEPLDLTPDELALAGVPEHERESLRQAAEKPEPEEDDDDRDKEPGPAEPETPEREGERPGQPAEPMEGGPPAEPMRGAEPERR
jgi:hypothetical protein